MNNEELQEETTRTVGGAAKTVGKLGITLLKGAGLIKNIKGVRHPDSLIKNKELYGLGDGANPRFSPIGRRIDNPMELYFGRAQRKMPEGAQVVYAAIQDGYTEDQLEVVTSLPPQQIARAIQYLRSKELMEEE